MRSRSRPFWMSEGSSSFCEMRATSCSMMGPSSSVFGDVVAGGADELDAAREGRVIRARAGEGGQERVVDVDDAARVGVDERGREDLHVAGEDDEVDLVLGEECELRGFDCGLGGGRDWHVVEGDAVELGERRACLRGC